LISTQVPAAEITARLGIEPEHPDGEEEDLTSPVEGLQKLPAQSAIGLAS
jgi:hypothetical protein